MEKYFSNFWRNTSGSEIKSIAVKMSDMLEALKQVGNNLEEALGILRQYPRQVSCPNPIPLKTHLHTVHSPPHYRHNHHPHSQTTPLNDGISFDFWDNVLILSLSIEKL